nr:ATP-dependent Clp protease proteolytic subunit [Rhodothermus marinus]
MNDLFFLFLILMSLTPALRQQILEARRAQIMRRLEQKRGSRVISLIHRQETVSLLGIGIHRYISIEDAEEVLRAIRLTDPACPIDMIVHTPGGLVLAAEQIAWALAQHPARVTVFVPHYAMSGGTLLALAADEIVMDPFAVLGPVDPQIGQYAAASILAAVRRKGSRSGQRRDADSGRRGRKKRSGRSNTACGSCSNARCRPRRLPVWPGC